MSVILDGILDCLLDLLTTFNTQVLIAINYKVIANFTL
jgi:hypothetical protein